jgi:hypothetical protein
MGVITGSLPDIRQSPDAGPVVLVAQSSGKIVRINDACADLLDISNPELVGMDFRDIFRVELPPPVSTPGAPISKSKIPGKWINHAETRINGHRKPFELSWKPVQLGWVGYWIVNLRETTPGNNDPLIDNLLDGCTGAMFPLIKMHANPLNGTGNWQMMSFHRPVACKGGDVLFIEEISPDYILYFLGDVSGHDNGARVVQMMLTSYLKVYRDDFNSLKAAEFPGELLSKMNDALCQDVHNDSLLTGIVLLLEKSRSRVWFASAGHHPVFLVQPEKGKTSITTDDIPLGIHSKIRYKNIELEFGPDDRLLCYTEGLVTRGPGYTIRQGLMSLLKTLEESKNAKPEELAGQLQKLWHGFGIKGMDIENDVTFTLFFQGQQTDLENRHRPVQN